LITLSILVQIALGALAFICAIIAILQTFKNHKLQKEIAIKQGIFLKPKLIININKYDPKTHYYILYGKLNPNRSLLIPYQIEIRNIGDKSINKVELNLRIHKRLHGELPPQALKYKGFGDAKSEIYEYSNFHLIRFDIETLNPEQGLQICDFLIIRSESILRFDSSFKTTDQSQIKLQTKLAYFNLIDYVVYSENQSPISGQVKLLVLNTTEKSLAETLEEYSELKSPDQSSSKKRIPRMLERVKKFFKVGTAKRIAFISFDESELIKQKDSLIDEVPIKSITIKEGLELPNGSIWHPDVYHSIKTK